MAKKASKSEATETQAEISSSSDAAAQVPKTRATGPETATGAQLLADKEIPSGEDRGSKVEIEGGDAIKPDWESPQATGAQLEPARFTSNGQIPHNSVGSASGSVPVSTLGLSVEDTRAKMAEVNQDHDDFVAGNRYGVRLSPETVSRLSAAELRAIGERRGYSIDETAGNRSVRDAFRKAQDADADLKARDEAVEAARAGRKPAGV